MFKWFTKRPHGSPLPRHGGGDPWRRIITDLEYLQRAHARSHPWLADVDPGKIDDAFQERFFRHFYETMQSAGMVQSSFEDWRREIAPAFSAKPFSRYEDPLAHTWLQQMSGQVHGACDRVGIKLPKAPVFGLLQTGRINGIAADVDNPEYYLILIDDGILGFANLLAKVVAACFPVDEDAEGGLTFRTDDASVAAERMRNMEPGRRLFDLLTAYAVDGAPHGAAPYLLATKHLRLVEVMRDSMEYFIFAHEFGHCAAGHLAGAPRQQLHMTSGEGGEFGMLRPDSWEKELEADCLGLILGLNVMQSQGFGPSLSYAGIELVFTGIDLMQRTLSILEHGEERERLLDTHPPALHRRDAIRQYTERLFDPQLREAALGLSDTVTSCLEFYWAPTASVLRKMHADGVRPHARWRQTQH